jgi:hypothetical protein
MLFLLLLDSAPLHLDTELMSQVLEEACILPIVPKDNSRSLLTLKTFPLAPIEFLALCLIDTLVSDTLMLMLELRWLRLPKDSLLIDLN